MIVILLSGLSSETVLFYTDYAVIASILCPEFSKVLNYLCALESIFQTFSCQY